MFNPNWFGWFSSLKESQKDKNGSLTKVLSLLMWPTYVGNEHAAHAALPPCSNWSGICCVWPNLLHLWLDKFLQSWIFFWKFAWYWKIVNFQIYTFYYVVLGLELMLMNIWETNKYWTRSKCADFSKIARKKQINVSQMFLF